MITWLIWSPVKLLDRLDRERRAAERVGGVDLVRAVAGDLEPPCRAGSTAGARRRPRSATASSCRTSAAGVGVCWRRAPSIRARLGRWSVPRIRTVSAEVSMFDPLEPARPGRRRDAAGLLSRRADHEQHQRQQQPSREGRPAAEDDPLPGDRPAAAAATLAPPRPVALVLGSETAVRPPRRADGPADPSVRPRYTLYGGVSSRSLGISAHIVTACLGGAPSASTWVVRSCWPARSIRGSRSTTASQRSMNRLDQSYLLDVVVDAVEEARDSGRRRSRGGRVRDPVADRSTYRQRGHRRQPAAQERPVRRCDEPSASACPCSSTTTPTWPRSPSTAPAPRGGAARRSC